MSKKNINPWGRLWIHPKTTIRCLIESCPTRAILWLAIVGGILSAFAWVGVLWIRYPERGDLHHTLFILALIVMGGLVGILHLYFGAWLYTLTGSWLGGKGNFTAVKCAVGWGNWPFIIANLLSIASLIVIPNPWLQLTFGGLNFIAAVWGLVLFFNLLGEAHRFSAWKAVLAVLIAAVLVLVALMIVSLLIPLLSPLFQ